ncbi:MAG: hypothetical protein RJA95_321 [Verrucomicrobiota bacterium]|jgi:hypothetical protein
MKAWLVIVGVLAAVWASAAPSVPVEPFVVSKLSPTGAYNPKDFAVLWSAFRQQYRVGANGTLVQQDYARDLIRKVDENSPFAFSDLTRLFGDNAQGKTAQMRPQGAELQRTPLKVLRTPKEAAEHARDVTCRLAEIQVGPPLTDRLVGAHAAVLLAKVPNEFDKALGTDDFAGAFKNTPTTLFLTDPEVVPFGTIKAHVEPTQGGFNLVGELADSKANQDRFMAALKGGAEFKVFWFREGLCYACKGSGLVPGNYDLKAKNPRNFQLSGGSLAVDEKCKTCGASGRLPRGHVSVLVWEKVK